MSQPEQDFPRRNPAYPARPSFASVAGSMVAAVLAGGMAGYVVSSEYKPAPVIVQPQTHVALGARAADSAGNPLSRSEKRRIEMVWGELQQDEVDRITHSVETMPKQSQLMIFCDEDSRCGDLALDFDNAFESAHWQTSIERPLIDSTVGITVSSPELLKAINDATNNRLGVKLIPPPKADYIALVIGRKPRS